MLADTFRRVAEQSIRRNQYKNNESNYKLMKETFTNLKLILNQSLYDTLMRYRDEYEHEYGRGSFYYYMINRYFDNRLCKQLKRVLITYNYEFTRLYKHNKYICYTILS